MRSLFLRPKGALLAAHLLDTLPGVLDDEDEGIAEALNRAAELEENPSIGLSLEQFDEMFRSRKS